ncbi:MAG TPA: hypothetical protein VFB99_03225, partial [Vicinamibacterales bacterium]|nr:hypothetical protein [Vicinamibacterales bacterium]
MTAELSREQLRKLLTPTTEAKAQIAHEMAEAYLSAQMKFDEAAVRFAPEIIHAGLMEEGRKFAWVALWATLARASLESEEG